MLCDIMCAAYGKNRIFLPHTLAHTHANDVKPTTNVGQFSILIIQKQTALQNNKTHSPTHDEMKKKCLKRFLICSCFEYVVLGAVAHIYPQLVYASKSIDVVYRWRVGRAHKHETIRET